MTDRSAHMTNEADMLALADKIRDYGSFVFIARERQLIQEALRAAARPSPDAGLIEREDAPEIFAEAFHTALRKASDPPKAGEAWKAIRELPNEEWTNIVAFVVDGIYGIESPLSTRAVAGEPVDLRKQFENIISALNYQGGVNGDENSLTVGEIRRAL